MHESYLYHVIVCTDLYFFKYFVRRCVLNYICSDKYKWQWKETCIRRREKLKKHLLKLKTGYSYAFEISKDILFKSTKMLSLVFPLLISHFTRVSIPHYCDQRSSSVCRWVTWIAITCVKACVKVCAKYKTFCEHCSSFHQGSNLIQYSVNLLAFSKRIPVEKHKNNQFLINISLTFPFLYMYLIVYCYLYLSGQIYNLKYNVLHNIYTDKHEDRYKPIT